MSSARSAWPVCAHRRSRGHGSLSSKHRESPLGVLQLALLPVSSISSEILSAGTRRGLDRALSQRGCLLPQRSTRCFLNTWTRGILLVADSANSNFPLSRISWSHILRTLATVSGL